MSSKLSSGKFWIAMTCCYVFAWTSINGTLDTKYIENIIMTAFAFYLGVRANSDIKPPPGTNA